MVKFYCDLNTRDILGEPETSMNTIFITKANKRKTTFVCHIYNINAKFRRVKNQEFRETIREADPEDIIAFIKDRQIIEVEGICNAVQRYINCTEFSDPETAKLWVEAEVALDDLLDHLDNNEWEKENG